MSCELCNQNHSVKECPYNDDKYKDLLYKNREVNDEVFSNFTKILMNNKKEVVRKEWIIIDICLLREYL